MEPAKHLTEQIRRAWRDRGRDVFKLASFCRLAEALPKSERAKLKRDVGFSKTTFSNLACIGRDARLHSEEVRSKVPHSYPTVVRIAKLSDYQLMAALLDGVIHPGVTRPDLAHWLESEAPLKPFLLLRLAPIFAPNSSEISHLLSIAKWAVEHPAAIVELPVWKNKQWRFKRFLNPEWQPRILD